MDTQERIIRIIRENIPYAPKDIDATSRFLEDIQMDSLELFQLVALAEDEFHCTITDEFLEECRTVEELAKYLDEQG